MNIVSEIRKRVHGALPAVCGEGAEILLTTHTGNYDLAAALFSPKFGRDLHTDRAPERSPLLQEIRRRELQETPTATSISRSTTTPRKACLAWSWRACFPKASWSPSNATA